MSYVETTRHVVVSAFSIFQNLFVVDLFYHCIGSSLDVQLVALICLNYWVIEVGRYSDECSSSTGDG